MHLHPIVRAELSSCTAARLGGFHGCFESGLVNFDALLTGHQGRQIHREPKGVVQFKHHVAGQFARRFVFLQTSLESFNAFGQGAQEGFLFFEDDAFDELLLSAQFRECLAHLIGEGRDEGVHERFIEIQEGITVPDGAAKDAADDVARPGVGGELSVGNAECHRTDVI